MPMELVLRDPCENDIPIFFAHQQDPEAAHMAAFTVKDPADFHAFLVHWARIMADETVIIKAILWNGRVVGHVARFEAFGEAEVTYWIGKECWGQGIATQALTLFLAQLRERPLVARAAKDNIASQRVLEKCGFRVVGEARGFANARGAEIDEFILVLDAPQAE